MIVGIYATLGVFPLIATRNPLENLSLIWLTVWSSLVHASIKAIQSFAMPENHGHLLGDVPALIVVAVALAALVRIGFFRLSDRSAAVPDLFTRRLAVRGCVLSRF